MMHDNIAPPLPNNLDAERALLGAMILHTTAALEVIATVRESDFFLEQHRTILRCAQSMMGCNETIDLVTLIESLKAADELERAGGAAYVASLIDGVPKISNVPHYAKIVHSLAKKRDLAKLFHSFEGISLDREHEGEAIAEDAIGRLLEILDDPGRAVRARPWAEVARSVVDRLTDAKTNPESSARMHSGLKDVDAMTSGLGRKELTLLVGPTGNGKTSLGATWAANASAEGFKVLYFSAEMVAEDIARRELSYRAGVKFYFTQHPENLNTDELDRISKAAREPVNIEIVDDDVTPARIWAMSEAAKRTRGLDLVVIDYDQLVIEADADSKADDDSIFRKQRAFVIGAAKLAKRLDIAVILLAQLRKIPASIERGARPRLDDIWGDSSMRNTPHLILWVKRDYFEHNMDVDFERVAHLYVLKSRNGRTGVVELDFDPERVRFLDATLPGVHVS